MRHNGKDDNAASISSDLGDYGMGCHMSIMDQTAYLTKMLKLLGGKIIEMEENVFARPTTVNLTFSVRKKRV